MFRQSLVLLLFFFQGYHSLDRDEIIKTYEPILNEKTANLTGAYSRIETESKIVTTQIQNETLLTMGLINSQVTILKGTVATAKNSSKDTNFQKCIKIQEIGASNLTAKPLNVSCWVDATFQDLTSARDAFRILSKIPSGTISACGILNPLNNQDEQFLQCISDKLLDLDEQLKILLRYFDGVRTEAIERNVQCLAQESALIGQEMGEIHFQIQLCLLLN